jgi:hypothetical protein
MPDDNHDKAQEDAEDMTEEELERLYDEIDARGPVSEEELWAMIDRLNAQANVSHAPGPEAAREPEGKTAPRERGPENDPRDGAPAVGATCLWREPDERLERLRCRPRVDR